MVFIRVVGFVWRQLEFAFFGALTSVGALFICSSKKLKKGAYAMGKNSYPVNSSASKQEVYEAKMEEKEKRDQSDSRGWKNNSNASDD